MESGSKNTPLSLLALLMAVLLFNVMIDFIESNILFKKPLPNLALNASFLNKYSWVVLSIIESMTMLTKSFQGII